MLRFLGASCTPLHINVQPGNYIGICASSCKCPAGNPVPGKPPTLGPSGRMPREGSKRPALGWDSGSEGAGPCIFASWGNLLSHLGASWCLSCQDSLKTLMSMVCYDFWVPFDGFLEPTPTFASGSGQTLPPFPLQDGCPGKAHRYRCRYRYRLYIYI